MYRDWKKLFPFFTQPARRTPARRTARLTLDALEARLAPAVITSWDYRGSGGGGSLFSPAFSPYNASEIYLSSDMGQVFHTTNLGNSWNQLDFRQIQGFHGPEVQFTNNPQVMYALDYTSIDGSDAVRPSKSTDGGVTWTRLASDPTFAEANRLYVDFNNPSHVLVSDYGHLYASQDGGQTWALKYTCKSFNGGLWLGGAFFDGNNVYLGSGDGLLVSADGGQSFALSSAAGIPATEGIASLAGAKQNGVTRLLVVTQDYANMYVGMETDAPHYYYKGVYGMDVGAGGWALKTTGLPTGSNGADPVFVAMAPNNINIAYLGGGRQSGVPSVYKTTTGGGSWSDVFLTTNNQNIRTGWSGQNGDRGWGYGEYLFGIAVAPTDPNRVVITDLGFAHATTDGGASWDALYVRPQDRNPFGNTPKGKNYHGSALDNTTSWQVAWADAQHLFVSNSDIQGQISDDGGQTFGFNYTGHTRNSMYRIAVHPQTGVLYGATSSVHDMYKSTRLTDSIIDPGNGAVMFSSNQGHAWQTLHDFNDPVMWVALDPTNANRLYAAVANSTNGGIWVTNNLSAGAASTWTRLAPPPRTQGHAFNVQVLNDGSLLATFSGRRTSSGNFTNSSGVFLSTDGGQTWLDRTASAMQFWTKDVVVDPTDSTQSTWYAGVWRAYGTGGPFTGGLYKTTNRGQTWTKILDLSRVTSITMDPTHPDEAYVTTEEEGLWYTSNLHAATPTSTQVASYGFKQPERVFFNPFNPNEVWVTSFGGGLMVGTVPQSTTPGQFALSASNYTVGESAGSVTITVARTGGSQGAVSVHYATANATATAGSDYTATSGTLTWADGDTASKTFTVVILNDTLVEGNEAFTVSLTAPTGGASLGTPATANVTIQDDDVAPVPGILQLSATAYSVNENAGNALLTVTRNNGSDGAVSVNYTLTAGTATAGQDYTGTGGIITLAASQTTATISIPIIDDALVEGNETLTVSLSNPTGGATLGTPTSATVTIVDNDVAQPGVFQFSTSTLTVSESAGVAVLAVTRTGGSAGAVTVPFTVAAVTATAGSDYTTTSGSVSFAAGETSKTLSIQLVNDTVSEPSETFRVDLGSPSAGSLGNPASATVTITDDDVATAPQLRFNPTAYNVKENAGTVKLTVQRVGTTTGTVTVRWRTYDITPGNTAWGGSDYVSRSGLLSFAPGETSKTIEVSIIDDTRVETDEIFGVELYQPGGGATLGEGQKAVVTIKENDSAFNYDKAVFETNEGVGKVTIAVRRVGSLEGAASVKYSTSSGIAQPPDDYKTTSGTLSFASGEEVKTFTVEIIDDVFSEPTEDFGLALSQPTGGVQLGVQTYAKVKIADNDSGPAGVLQFAAASYSVREGTATLVITVNRVGGSTGVVTVGYSASNDWAVNGQDFDLPPGTLTFANGETSKTITITIRDDKVREGTEYFSIALGNPTGGAGLGKQWTTKVTLLDND